MKLRAGNIAGSFGRMRYGAGSLEAQARDLKLLPAVLIGFSLLVFAAGCSVMPRLPGFEKRKLLTVFHLLETQKFTDAKELIEEMMEDEEAVQWSRLWYARGMLCQDAYREGKSKKRNALMTLYPDQLYEGWSSFEKSLSLDREGRVERALPARYILLANEFQQLGHQHYRAGRHGEALRAFGQALTIAEGSLLSTQTDTGLIYNAALAAYAARSWDEATKHLQRLHALKYNPNATHLLAYVHIEKNDTVAAVKVLAEGMDQHNYPEELVVLYADLSTRKGDTKSAIKALTAAAKVDTANHRFPYSIGLIHQQAGNYSQAIAAYHEAHELAPDEAEIMVLVATCYYNQGVITEERTRFLSSKTEVQIQRTKSAESFRNARIWLEKTIAQQPNSPQLLLRIRELNQALRVPSKADSLMLGD